MIETLKKIGVGKEKLKNLNYREAFFAHRQILNNKATDIQKGYFFGAMRIKHATEEELKGFLDATKNEIKYIETDEIHPLDIAANYDGKTETLHILPASIFIATGAGAKIVGHGNNKVPPKYGITYHEVLNGMGCSYFKNEAKILKALELSGFAFYHQKYYNQKLHFLLEKRRELGLRTYLNTIEKILNPFKTSKLLIGTSHKKFITKYLEIAYYMGFNNIFVVGGLEGGVEPFPNRETKVNSTKIFGINIRPKNFNVRNSSLKLNNSIKDNSKICISILKNENNPFREWAILTAGLLLVAYGKTEDLKEAIKLSEESLKLNIAYEMFEIYKNISNANKKVIF